MYLVCAVRAHRPVPRARTLGTPFTDAAWLASSCGPCRWAPTHDQGLHSVTVRSAALHVRASPASAARSERKSAHLWCRPWVRNPAQAGLARIAHCLPAGAVTGRGWCPGLDGLRRCSGCPGICPSSHIAPTMAASKMARWPSIPPRSRSSWLRHAARHGRLQTPATTGRQRWPALWAALRGCCHRGADPEDGPRRGPAAPPFGRLLPRRVPLMQSSCLFRGGRRTGSPGGGCLWRGSGSRASARLG